MASFEEIRKLAEKNYEHAWELSKNVLKFKGRGLKFKKERGKPHPLFDLIGDFRMAFLKYGFQELELPTIVNAQDVYKQYGPEAPIILDRCFYLAELPRPDIGISAKIASQINKIAKVSISKLKQIFREYKEGKIEADDLIGVLSERLAISQSKSAQILSLFQDFLKLQPIPTSKILRSHLTSAWFSAICAMLVQQPTPLKLFSIGKKYRREQKLDPSHLYESWTASCTVTDPNITLADGHELAQLLLMQVGFDKVKIVQKKITSKYYAPDSEFEIFVKYKGKYIEIGDGGLYCPIALANYNIPYPVLNIGFGLERIAAIKCRIDDIRKLAYPYKYVKVAFSDRQIARQLQFVQAPHTKEGKQLMRKLIHAILKHKSAIGPTKILVHKNKVKVYIAEPEAGKALLGPAGLNEIYVYNGNIYGIPPDEKEIRQKGIRVCSYLEALCARFAALAEQRSYGRHTVRLIDTLPSLNLKLPEHIYRYLLSNNKKIKIGGPVFLDVEIEK